MKMEHNSSKDGDILKEDGKATLVMPSDLPYGDSRSGEVVPPGSHNNI